MKKNNSLATRFLFAFMIAGMIQTSTGCAGQRPVEKVTQNVCISLDSAEKSIPEISKTAELIAERWIDGGTLCVDGTKEWATEIYYRAGGLAHLKFLIQYPDLDKYNQKSIVLAGYLFGGDDPGRRYGYRSAFDYRRQCLADRTSPAGHHRDDGNAAPDFQIRRQP